MVNSKLTWEDIIKFEEVAGYGTQIKLGISVSWYEKMGLLKDIK